MCKILFFRAELFSPESQEETRRVEEVRPPIENTVAVLKVMKYDCEKPIGPQLQLIMSSWLPPVLDPFDEILSAGQSPRNFPTKA